MSRLGLAVLVALVLPAIVWASPLLGPRRPLNTNATEDTARDWLPSVVSDGRGSWFAVWLAIEPDPPYERSLLMASSRDDGETWSAPTALETGPGRVEYGPALATDGAGTLIVAWSALGPLGTDYDRFVSRSTDDGVTWSLPAPLNDNAASDTGNDRGGRVLVAPGQTTWVAVWSSDEDLEGSLGTDEDLLFSRSADGGASWSSPAPLEANAALDAADDRGVSLATDGRGRWCAVWWNNVQPGDSEIWISRSLDDGASWTPRARVEADAGDFGRDISPSIATDGAGSWVVAWSSLSPQYSPYHIVTARSTDDCASFTEPARIRPGLPLPYDEVGSQLATDRHGTWVLAWTVDQYIDRTEHSDGEAFFARSFDAGETWGDPAAMNAEPWEDRTSDAFTTVVPGRRGVWRGIWSAQGEFAPGVGEEADLAIVRLDVYDLPALSPVGGLLLAACLVVVGRAARSR